MNTELKADKVQKVVDLILEKVGSPQTEEQKQALFAFQNGDSATIKRLSVMNLSDNYLKCLGYLVSAPKLTPNTDTILAEAARAAANHVYDQTLETLSEQIGISFE
jgi:hypothetical protein